MGRVELTSKICPGDPNIPHDSLVDIKNIIFPPTHIKLGIRNQFVRALPTEETVSHLANTMTVMLDSL